MKYHRHKDHGPARVNLRLQKCRILLQRAKMIYMRSKTRKSAVLLLAAARAYEREIQEGQRYRCQLARLRATQFHARLADMTQLLQHFSFPKDGIQRLVNVLDWPHTRTKRNGYAADDVMVMCVLLARFTSPRTWKWMDMEAPDELCDCPPSAPFRCQDA